MKTSPTMNDTELLERAVILIYECARRKNGVRASVQHIAHELKIPIHRIKRILGFSESTVLM